MKRATYQDCVQKKRLRDKLFSNLSFDTVVGLAGPDFHQYMNFLKSKGIKNALIYENDKKTLGIQLLALQKKKPGIKMELRLGDINDCNPNYMNAVYDLDYCSTILKAKDSIAKFKNNFIMTFALRKYCSEMNTYMHFLELRGETQKGNLRPLEDGFSLTTTKNKVYNFHRYKSGADNEGGTNMIVITTF